jgi:Nuclease-related domain
MSQEQTPLRLRSAGEHARAHGLALNNRLLLLVLSALAALLAAGPVFGLRGLPLVLFELTAIGAMVAANRWYSPQIGRWLRGAEGERQVGAALAELTADGWLALHDVSLGRGNVDHILIGPGGIFTIETKSHRGNIRIDGIDPRMVKQAYAEKKLIERITGMEAQPLLVFSRAWLIGSVPAQRKGVTILPARLLGHYFSRRRPVLAADRAEQIHSRLAQALADL